MEDKGVDATVIESRQHQLGQMADFPPLLTILVLTYKTLIHLKLNLGPWGTH